MHSFRIIKNIKIYIKKYLFININNQILFKNYNNFLKNIIKKLKFYIVKFKKNTIIKTKIYFFDYKIRNEN